MGGAACAIPANAIMGGMEIPTHAKLLPVFDGRLRTAFAQSDVVAGIVAAGKGQAACDILAKPTWTDLDRSNLYDMLEALYDT
jgi:hypothetical protein